MRKLAHFGIPTSVKHENESYMEDIKLFVTDADKSDNKIEFLRFEDGSPMPELLKKVPHIAYYVDSIDDEMVGKEILLEPFMAGPTLKCAFIIEEGIPVEFMEVQ